MKTCSHCILPETFPGIIFNAQGLCNHCQNFNEKKIKLVENKKKYEQRFFDFLSELNKSPNLEHATSYDILMAYSGGKDSTYSLALLRKKYRLRVLAITFDNGFISQTAIANIKKITDNLGVDHIFFKPKWHILKRIFSAATERELYPKKTLERASTICTSCMGIVKSICLKMAIELGIPMIGYGWSPGQAPIQSSLMKNSPSLVRVTQHIILNPLREVTGDEIETYFLQEKHYLQPERFPYNVHLMAWEFYDESMIIDEITQFGWVAPDDTDSNSTNCLLNAFANDIHMKKYGFHPYVWEIANMVREGVIKRDEGYEKIHQKQPLNLIKMARDKLFISDYHSVGS